MPRRERVRAAIKNSGLQFPNKGYVVNLSPADLPKHGPAYDLAIAVGVLASTDQVPLAALENTVFIGELSLDLCRKSWISRFWGSGDPISLSGHVKACKGLYLMDAHRFA